MSQVELTPCIIWLWGQDSSGYGRLKFRGKPERAHRAIFIENYGDIPEGLLVRHKCDNRLCVNIDHLELGTIQDNVRDREDRGRGSKGSNRPSAILDDASALELFNLNLPYKILASMFGVSKSTVNHIKNKRKWRHIHV